jgi:hypothetical protein
MGEMLDNIPALRIPTRKGPADLMRFTNDVVARLRGPESPRFELRRRVFEGLLDAESSAICVFRAMPIAIPG